MSDDMWRRAEDEQGDEFDDFGELRFADDDETVFGATDEIRFEDSSSGVARGASESDVDIWGSYSATAPRPIPDRPAGTGSTPSRFASDSGPIDRTPLSDAGRLGRREVIEPADAGDDFGEIRFADSPEDTGIDFGFSDEPKVPVSRSESDTSGSRPRIKLGEPTTEGRRERGSGALRRPPVGPTGPTTLPLRPTRRDDDSRPDQSRSGGLGRERDVSNPVSRRDDDDFSLFGSESEDPWDTPREYPRERARDASRDTNRDPSGPIPRRPVDREPRRDQRPMIGSDDPLSRPASGGRPRPPVGRSGPARPARVSRPRESQGGVAGRDMPTAIAVGLLIAAAFVGALMWRPVVVLALVVLICGLAAIEFFDKVTEKGYRPATIVGILAAVIAPLAGYWVGDTALPLVMVFAMITTAFTFVGATGLHSSPIPNMSITSLGIMWIGLMGSYAALLAGVSNVPGLGTAGTDTLFIVAVGVVANDVGALFVGSAAGSTPLRQWISPNKTVEGLMGGTVATLFAMWIVGLQSDTWNDIGEIVILALAVAVLAPLGDLVESMFKRNLEIKDFGTLVKGHGGVLDRFDGFLFVLPAAYYLLQVLEPYAS